MLLSRFLIKFTMTPPLPNDPPRNTPFASIFGLLSVIPLTDFYLHGVLQLKSSV